ncbi:MAG: mechanosensitive ion channel, partial [Bacteroidetes bacterium]|nr:mechanosensitive ion channel [Bacteroidota bacterium]
MDSVYNILELELVHIGNYTIKVFSLVAIVVIFLLTKLTLWLIKKALFRKRKKELVDEGNALALFQLIRYLIWVVSIGIILHVIGLKLTVLIAGSAALLVGVGLGLQQTFNDVISGIILLSERSIKVGDILEI